MLFKRIIVAQIFFLISFYAISAKTENPDTFSVTSGGLKFSSKNVYSSQRTSLQLFKDYEKTKSFSLKFNCSIYNPQYFGFILRVIDKEQTSNSHFLHLLYIPSQTSLDSCSFEFHFSGSQKIVTFKFDTLHLNRIFFEIEASPGEKMIAVTCNKERKTVPIDFPSKMRMNFIFGLYGENTDVPAMILQNIRLKLNDKSDFFWPLNDWSGNAADEKINHVRSEVVNPTWLQNKHYFWEKIYTGNMDIMTGVTFNSDNNIVFVNKDSLVSYNPLIKNFKVLKYKTPRPYNKDTHFSIFNPKENKILSYDFQFLRINEGQKTVSEFNSRTNSWSKVDTSGKRDRNHHHTVFWNQDTTALITFGGYSYFHYYNTFKSYDFSEGTWKILKFKGDSIYPRTHSTIGRNPFDKRFYLYGGFGNKDGLQTSEGKYFKDLYSIDLDSRIIKEIWHINDSAFEFVPRGNPVFSQYGDVFYILGSKPIEKSNLCLYEISLTKPQIRVVSNNIPVTFKDMAGNAFLFCNQLAGELYCVTRETNDKPYSIVSIYKLKFPPANPSGSAIENSGTAGLNYLVIAGILLLLFLGIFFYYFRSRKNKPVMSHETELADTEKYERKSVNAIWLLNEFRAFDQKGHDISFRFAKKIKQAFLILFFESYYNDGISSSDFSEILWPNLQKDQQKNNRGVTLNGIRKILEDFTDISLVKENNKWKLTFGPGFYIDFAAIHTELQAYSENKESNERILNLFAFGNLLYNESWEYLDTYKEKFSSTAIELLLQSCENAFGEKNYLKSIEISGIVLNHFDFLSETALIYQVKSLSNLKNNAKALSEYNKFRKKYSENLSENFSLSFEDILSMDHVI